jgi:ATP-dependent RNA helicase SUPV3L1/SUV3
MTEDESTPSEDAPSSAPDEAPSPAPTPTFDFSDLRGFQSLTTSTHADDEAYRAELAKELIARAERFVQSVDDSIVLASDGVIRWLGDPIARLVAGEELLKPRAVLLADDALPAEHRDAAERRLTLWIAAHVRKILGPLEALSSPESASEAVIELSRKVTEALGVLDREKVRQQVKTLDQNARAALRKLGVRFGAHYVFVPALMKPAARALSSQLWSLKHGSEPGADRLLAYAAAGRTSFGAEGALSADSYRVAGFRLCGERVVRVDIVERLTDLIRAAIPDLMRPGATGVSEAAGFAVTHQMTSLTGCAGEAFASILRSLGFEPHQVKKSAYEATRRRIEPAKIEPIAQAVSEPDTTEATPPEGEASDASGDAIAVTAQVDEAEAADAQATSAESSEAPQAEAAEAEASEPAVVEAEPIHAAEPQESPEPAAAEAEAAPEAEVVESAPAAVEVESDEAAPSEALAVEASEDTVSESSVETEAAAAATEEEAPATVATEETAAEEEAMIEVWRPTPRRRQPHHHRGEHRPPPPEGTGRIVWRARDPKETNRRSGGAPQNGRSRDKAPESAPASEPGVQAEAVPTAEPPRREEFARYERPGRNDQRPPFKGPRRDERRDEGAPKGGDRPPRKEPRAPTVDPDSPFAKLLALRPLLEKRDKRT